MGCVITEIARSLSMGKFYSSVAKMQKNRMTTPNVWASFRPQNRQEVQIPANFAVKSWEDQIFGARRRCHRTTDKDHAIPVKQGSTPCFFLPFDQSPFHLATLDSVSMRQGRAARRSGGIIPRTGSRTWRRDLPKTPRGPARWGERRRMGKEDFSSTVRSPRNELPGAACRG